MSQLSESEILEKLKLNKPSVTSEEERRLKLIKCRLDAVKYREWLQKVESLRQEALEWFPVSKITNTSRQAKLKESIGSIWEAVNFAVSGSYGSANSFYLDMQFHNEDKRFARWQKSFEDAESKLEQERSKLSANSRKVEKAILYLQDKGLKFCVDFGIDNCVEKANQVALDLEIKRLVDEGEYISFNGDDYCEDCAGWLPDELSSRCQCGNRRVSFDWDWDGLDFEHLYVYAVAY